jgi:hypothetical protein
MRDSPAEQHLDEDKTMAELRRVSSDTELHWHADPEFLEWYAAPGAKTRDSGPLDESNHAAMLKMLAEVDKDANDHRVVRIGHWGCGWIDGIIVRPGSECERVAQEAADLLESYCLLDETDYSEREWNEFVDLWADAGAGDFRDSIRSRLPLLAEDEWEKFEAIGDEVLRQWYMDHAAYPYECEDSGVYISKSQYEFVDYDNFRSFLARQEPENPAQMRLFEVK